MVALSDDGVVAIATKRLLPNYDVFDEQRYFHPGVGPNTIINVRGVAVGLLICEDVWTANGPAAELARQGATMLVVANASPYARGRREERETMLRERAIETNCPIAYVNLVGGQDELVYDGQSLVVNAQGDVIARATAFSEELLVCDIDARDSTQGVALNIGYARDDERLTALHVNRIAEPLSEVEEVYQALVMGTRDYLRKNGFRTAVIALSGGVDSSLVAAIAVDAVGARAVRGFAMPSRYSSDHSLADAEELASRLDIELTTIPIESAHAAFGAALGEALDGEPKGITDENLQSRIRGVLMMAGLKTTPGRSCSRPVTSPRSRRGTPRSTVTRSAASRSSRTFRRPWFTSSVTTATRWPPRTAIPSRSRLARWPRRRRPNCDRISATTSHSRPMTCSTPCSSSTWKTTPRPRR